MRVGVLALPVQCILIEAIIQLHLAPYGLLPASQPNAACMHASGAPSFACELKWTLGMVADVEAVMMHLLPVAAASLALAAVFALACSTSQ